MGDADSTERKPKYVWDPQKLTWVEQAEPATATPVEEVAVKPPQKRVSKKAPAEVIPVEVTAKAEEMQYRGALIRILAFAIDFGLIALINFILTKVWHGMPSAVLFALLFIYFVGFWGWRGQTPGKMLIRAKVVRLNGSRIGLLRSLLRFLVYFLYLFVVSALGGGIIYYIIVGLIALLIIAFTKKKRGLHDFVAGTVVINSRPPKPQPVEVEAADADEATETAESPVASEPETDMTDQEK